LSGMRISEDVSGLARELAFQDENAFVADENITPPVRARLLEAGQLIKDGERYRYTVGVPLEEVRKLLGPDGVTTDRSLK